MSSSDTRGCRGIRRLCVTQALVDHGSRSQMAAALSGVELTLKGKCHP